MSGTTIPKLGRVLRSAARSGSTEAADRELLHRFARHGDDAAFAALVRRHAGMVLGVCRRALPTVQDAEDACQATFLVLARKARGTRWQASVANWLHATARRVAGNARVAGERRARREARAAVPEAVHPADRMTGRELLEALDEELGRLPPDSREALVLCYLEGLTQERAAARLGVPVATLNSRVARGRKRLHQALTRRGVVLGAGLLALAATTPAGASPPGLVEAVRSAVAGKAPPAVAALAAGVGMSGIVKKALLGAFLAAATAVVGFGLGQPRATTAGQPPDKAMPARAAGKKDAPVAKAAERPGPTYAGRVVGPDDKPVAGAAVFAFGPDGSDTVRSAAGPDGGFRITLPADRQFTRGLFATAAGFGIGRVEPPGDMTDDLTIRLVADHPVAGRVVTTEGKPVAGARLTIDRIAEDVGDLDKRLSLVKAGGGREGLGHGRSMPTDRAELGTTAVTDATGKFRLAGGGKDRVLYVDVRGDGIVSTRLTVVNRPGFDPEPYNAAARRMGDRFDRRSVLHGPDLNLVAEREKLVRGRVTDAATGGPRAGVLVQLTRSRSDLLPVIREARTDTDGRYEIRGAGKANGYMVEVAADTTAGYMPCQGWADDTTGYEPVAIDLRVRKGVVVTGRIIDKGTGKPVPGWALVGVPQGNPSVKDYPEFDSSAWFPMQRTGAEGRFRVVAIPGPVLLFGQPENADFPKYKPPVADPKYPQFFKALGDHAAYFLPGGAITPLQGRYCKVLDIPAGAKEVEHDIVLEPVEPPAKKDGPDKKP